MATNDRKRETVPLLGLNTSQSDLHVKDGCCSRLHNMRYSGGAWHNTAPFRELVRITDSGQYRILYKHPASAADRFIAVKEDNSVHEVHHRQPDGSTKSHLETLQTLLPAGSERTITHFGNVLILRDTSTGTLDQFIFMDGRYTRYEVPAPPKINCMNLGYGDVDASYWLDKDLKAHAGTPPNPGTENGVYVDALYYRIYDISSSEIYRPANNGKDDLWYGDIALFAVFRMKDGTSLSPSRLEISSSIGYIGSAQPDEVIVCADRLDTTTKALYLEIKCPYNKVTDPFWKLFFQTRRSRRGQCSVSIEIDKDAVNGELIDRVSVYATRINPVYDYTKLTRSQIQSIVSVPGYISEDDLKTEHKVDSTKIYGKPEDLIDQPFYLVKDICIDDFPATGQYTLTIGYSLLKNIEQNTVYEPNQNLHTLSAGVLHDYNERLHMGDLTTKLFEGYGLENTAESQSDTSASFIRTSVVTSGKTAYAIKESAGCMTNYLGSTRIVSYPDYRATDMGLFLRKPDGQVYNLDNRKLHQAPAINYAFHISEPTDDYKYPPLGEFNGSPDQPYLANIREGSGVIIERNRLQVSGLNNPLSLPFASSYRIGDSAVPIRAINSIADQLSDAKFGEFPLYIFTDEGIWALQNGKGEVVYSNLTPINHDRITNPSTVAAAYNVFYLTSRGLMAIQGRYAKLLSEAINDPYNNVPTDFFAGATLHFQHRYNELLLHNPAYGYAYVYSIPEGQWSTRDFPGLKLNDNHVVDQSNTLYDFESEENVSGVSCLLATRPLKFGSTEFKRIETLVTRLVSETLPAEVSLKIEGSYDLINWFVLRDESVTTSGDLLLRRTPASAKFFRITLTARVTGAFTLNSLDFELYTRMLHRLR